MAGKWLPIENVPRDRDVDVLLCWTFPDGVRPDIRIGRFFTERFDGGLSFRLEMDCGDSGAWYFTPDDYTPTHWQPLPEPPESATQPLPPPNEE